ncbi:MAG: APC family permease [Vicinamibacterales bacterium]
MDDGDLLNAAPLQRRLHVRDFFGLAFGAIIGVGWLIMVGDWLRTAGPLGAIAGFALAGGVMMIIGLCYAELATMIPDAGGESAYARRLFGPGAQFALGWFLAMGYIAIASFEAISVGWVAATLMPGVLEGVLFTAFGAPVTIGAVAYALAGSIVFTWLNYRNAGTAVRAQNLMAYTLVGIAAVLLATALWRGSASNLEPWLAAPAAGLGAWSGIAAVAISAPFWFGGFNMIPQLLEEAAPGESLLLVGRVIILSIASALVFYIVVIGASALLVPWPTLGDAELAVASAFARAFHTRLLRDLVLGAALIGLLSTWNAYLMAASRLLFSLGRAGLLPAVFSRTHPRYGTPASSVLFVGVISMAGALAGREGLSPIVNAVSVSLGLAYLVTSVGVVKLRIVAPQQVRPYAIPGGLATAGAGVIGSALFLSMAVYQPYAAHPGTVPLEWWILGAWLISAAAVWMFRRGRG